MNIKKTIKYFLITLLLTYIISGLYGGIIIAKEIKAVNDARILAEEGEIRSKMTIETMEIPKLIEYTSPTNQTVLKAISKCESGQNPDAINYHDGGHNKHSVGILQFQEATFKYWSSKMGERLDYYSSYDQIRVADFMITNGQIHQWSCAKILKLV